MSDQESAQSSSRWWWLACSRHRHMGGMYRLHVGMRRHSHVVAEYGVRVGYYVIFVTHIIEISCILPFDFSCSSINKLDKYELNL